MSKEELIKKVKEGYWPGWEPAPKIEEVIKDVEELYGLSLVLSGSYYKLKAKVITYLSMNFIEQFEREKREQGMLTKRILEDLLFDLSEAEEVAEIK